MRNGPVGQRNDLPTAWISGHTRPCLNRVGKAGYQPWLPQRLLDFILVFRRLIDREHNQSISFDVWNRLGQTKSNDVRFGKMIFLSNPSDPLLQFRW